MSMDERRGKAIAYILATIVALDLLLVLSGGRILISKGQFGITEERNTMRGVWECRYFNGRGVQTIQPDTGWAEGCPLFYWS